MDKFTEEIISLIESHYVLNRILGNDYKFETIRDEVAIILYKNLRVVILDDSFIFVNIKLDHRLNKRSIYKLCKGLCCKVEHRFCTYNKKEFINLITLINIPEQQYEILKIFEMILELIP